jgi:hypothetical protein
VPNPLRRSPHPLLLEIPARAWIRSLSDAAGRPLTLAEVPDEPLDELGRHGFHGVWLMGGWTTGPGGRALALHYPDLLATYQRMIPDWEPRDVGGSPYSIRAYEPWPPLGDLDALATFRERLLERGLGLVLDFVPNHVSFDHPWLDERPDLLVQGTARDLARDPASWFVHTSPDGTDRIFAHGRDPHFPGWSDTCQVDYRRREARQAMADILHDLADRCDGLRCDMAMLVLEDVFRGTWGEDENGEAGTFWKTVIPEVRRKHPEILFIAEVYWGLEGRMRDVGFDFTYDKDLYDKLVAGDVAGLAYRGSRPLDEQLGNVRFLENHDEPRVNQTLGPERMRPAAAFAYTLPGLRFFQEGQESGRRLRPPVQLARAPVEAPDESCRAFHERLFALLTDETFHGGEWAPLEIRADGEEDPSRDGLLGNRWTHAGSTRVVVANFAAEPRRGRVLLPLEGPDGAVRGSAEAADTGLDGAVDFEENVKSLREVGLLVEIPAHDYRAYRIERAARTEPVAVPES